jgi:hypothetical protein
MAKSWEFSVIGKGRFPFDMLRYDACYPMDSESAAALGFDRQYDDPKAEREIKLRSKICEPTTDRWSSFGWRVGQIKKI